MPDPKVHFLNVRKGDCFLIERPSGRLTMIDICCGNMTETERMIAAMLEKIEAKPRGNFRMCKQPTNPIEYMAHMGLSDVFRFILTHPDMDHMDGIQKLFSKFNVQNYWDCGIRKKKPDFKEKKEYSEEDWDFYDDLIHDRVSGTKVISPRAGDSCCYYGSDDNDNSGSGDYISIVSPSQKLVDDANMNGNVNDASYVIVYRSSAGRIIFGGDSNATTWEYILDNHKSLVSDAAVLFAPHHGRKKNQDFSYLDVVKPRITFFGCASSDHLAYSAWQNRNLLFFTNNQCGNTHIYPDGEKIHVYIENDTYASAFTEGRTFQKNYYWYLCTV
jgi:beta-lactamase superfamily II metal-dependent hydrolase